MVTNRHFLESPVMVEAIFYDGSLANTAERLREKQLHLGSNCDNNHYIQRNKHSSILAVHAFDIYMTRENKNLR